MAGKLTGQTALVTGAGRGFGKAIALGLAAEGAAVTVTARSRNQLDAVVFEIGGTGGQALAIEGNVTDRADVARVVAAAEKRFGPLSILVNNAGVTGPFGPAWAGDPDEWWAAHSVILRGTLLFMSAIMPGMVRRRSGRVINVASLGGQWFTPYLSCYGVAKLGQIRLSEYGAAEAEQHGVQVFSIEPGTVITDMAEYTMASADAQKWVPKMVDYLRNLKTTGDPSKGLARCAEMCVDLAGGRYDALAGRFLLPKDDFEKLLLEPIAKPGTAIVTREPPRTR
jgi:NAD(P)-dependent dehydrogenase (short-subunit alcohol dehydrogenase family)